jgi:hypothetical protein
MSSHRYPFPYTNVIALLLFTVSSASVLSGCGSAAYSGAGTIGVPNPIGQTGRALLTMRWPDRDTSRLIPIAANSIRVRVTASGNRLIGDVLLSRPANGGTATATFDRLPIETVAFAAVAFPNADGTGAAQALAGTTVPIRAGQVAEVRLTLTSTIDHLEITPATPTVTVGETIPLNVAARNATGEIVLTHPTTIAWSSGNEAVVTVTSNGTVQGVSPGTAIIHVTEQESGKSAEVSVTVSPALPPTNDALPIPMTGFNQDVIFENQATTSAVPFDDTTTTWVENGLKGAAGLPAARFTSRLTNPVTGSSTFYEFQPFAGNNILALTYAASQGTLTLAAPARFRALSIVASSSNARFVPGIGKLVLNFDDGTSSGEINYNARDWWGEGANNDPSRVFASGLNRTENAGSNLPLASVRIDGSFRNFNLYETTLDLSNIGGVNYTGKRLRSITFQRASNVRLTAIFAVSGASAL